VPEQLAKEIDQFEAQIALRKLGKIDERVFAETRLRRGAYGQRYDNGHRHDGITTQDLSYPTKLNDAALTKGPDTFWDAPGMQRIKIPYGALSPEKLEVLADLAEEYSDGICHVTTRQDIQLHFIHIEDTPTIFRRLAAVGITTREACGNSVRNVTACPKAGVCKTETFDVTPYAKACAFYLLGHPDTQDFGRKFKIAFSGCEHEACALGFDPRFRWHRPRRASSTARPSAASNLSCGGGLGAVPQQAKLFDEFLPEEELLPIARAIGRVFARLGEKKNRNKARLKFVVQKLGIDEFRRIVMEEPTPCPKIQPGGNTLTRFPSTKTSHRSRSCSLASPSARKDTTCGPQLTSTSSDRPAIRWSRSYFRWAMRAASSSASSRIFSADMPAITRDRPSSRTSSFAGFPAESSSICTMS
jgi:sulfite reductase (ferredoxin)